MKIFPPILFAKGCSGIQTMGIWHRDIFCSIRQGEKEQEAVIGGRLFIQDFLIIRILIETGHGSNAYELREWLLVKAFVPLS